MHQDHVTSRRRILDNLERHPIDLFNTCVKPRDPRFRISRGVQIPEVRMPFERFTELRTSSPRWRWMLRKPPMHKAMRCAKNVCATAMWSNVGQHRVYFHATGGQQPASVIAINMPASSRYIPLTPDWEL